MRLTGLVAGTTYVLGNTSVLVLVLDATTMYRSTPMGFGDARQYAPTTGTKGSDTGVLVLRMRSYHLESLRDVDISKMVRKAVAGRRIHAHGAHILMPHEAWVDREKELLLKESAKVAAATDLINETSARLGFDLSGREAPR